MYYESTKWYERTKLVEDIQNTNGVQPDGENATLFTLRLNRSQTDKLKFFKVATE